jgi:HlyD family secretion protein
MTRKRKVLIGLGVGAVLTVFVVLALSSESGQTVDVRVEQVGRRDLVAKVTASGHIEPKRSVDISADISGRIVELPVEEGQDVREGDLLLVIDPARYRAAVQQYQAGLAEARAREAQARSAYDQARRDFERTRALKEATPDLVTDQELELARTDASVKEALWRAAEHAVARAQASLTEAQDLLDKTVIRAPMSGRITRLNVERGETAIVGTMNNPGSLLLTVADLSEMEAVVEVDETDVPEISIGDSTVIEIDAFPGRTFVGRVTKIGNSSIRPRSSLQSSAEQAIDFEVRIELDDPPDGIRPDLSATSDVVVATASSAVSIPIISLTLLSRDDFEAIPNENLPESASDAGTDEVQGVFVLDGDRVRFRPVEVGIAGDNYFEVLSGLEEGETVVSGTYQAIRQLKDGARVKVTGEDNPAAEGEPGSSDDEAVAGTPTAEAATPSQAGVDSETTGAELPYSLLVASYSSPDQARKHAGELEASINAVAFVAPTRVDGQTYYRVFAGALADRDAALGLMDELVRDGRKDERNEWDVRPVKYAYLVETFDTSAAARKAEAQLEAAGVDCYVVRVRYGSATSYQLLSGAFESPDDAIPPSADVLSDGKADLVVRTGMAG